jgi:uncharacterized coiled-coil protein SlyX
MNGADGSRTVSDPTPLTTEQLLREISSLRAILETRMDGMDRVLVGLLREAASQQTRVDDTVAHLRTLHEEKFRSIEKQFAERDTRDERTSRDSKTAVDAALQAAKEMNEKQNTSSALAIAKSETATMKQIDQLGATIASQTKNLDDKIDDLKGRVLMIEGRGLGGRERRESSVSGMQLAISAITVLISIAAVIVSVKSQAESKVPPQVLVVPQPPQPAQPSTTAAATRSPP